MKINTRDFGIIEIEEDAIYSFPEGVYGFEDDKQFAIFEKSFEDVSFLYMQSVSNPTPCFLIFEPWDLYPNYEPILLDEDLSACEVKSVKDLIFLTIANVSGPIEELSINVKSPIVLNPKTKKARQVILQNPDYTVRYYPFNNDREAGVSC